MIISTTKGSASIMGDERAFEYDHAYSCLVIKNLSFDEARHLVSSLEEGSPLVSRETPSEPITSAPPMRQLALVPDRATNGHSNGKSGVVVDTAKIAALAAGNPKPPPKPEKPKKPTKEEKAAEAKAATTAAEVEEEEIPFPEGAEVVADEPEEDEEPKAKAKPAGAVPAKLLEAKKLRDVLGFLMDVEGITDSGALKERCDALKEQVPCLLRITDLDSRIDRTLEVMDLSADVS